MFHSFCESVCFTSNSEENDKELVLGGGSRMLNTYGMYIIGKGIQLLQTHVYKHVQNIAYLK